jgi:hypothetical protein
MTKRARKPKTIHREGDCFVVAACGKPHYIRLDYDIKDRSPSGKLIPPSQILNWLTRAVAWMEDTK